MVFANLTYVEVVYMYSILSLLYTASNRAVLVLSTYLCMAGLRSVEIVTHFRSYSGC